MARKLQRTKTRSSHREWNRYLSIVEICKKYMVKFKVAKKWFREGVPFDKKTDPAYSNLKMGRCRRKPVPASVINEQFSINREYDGDITVNFDGDTKKVTVRENR